MDKPKLFLAGSHEGAPTFEELLALAEGLMGRKATAEEIEAAKKILARRDERRGHREAPGSDSPARRSAID